MAWPKVAVYRKTEAHCKSNGLSRKCPTTRWGLNRVEKKVQPSQAEIGFSHAALRRLSPAVCRKRLQQTWQIGDRADDVVGSGFKELLLDLF